MKINTTMKIYKRRKHKTRVSCSLAREETNMKSIKSHINLSLVVETFFLPQCKKEGE
jgi:hypothetical protein